MAQEKAGVNTVGENRVGIQIDKPVPPWERPGCFRMDCERHRGNLLSRLALASFLLSVSCCGSFLGIPLGFWCWRMAKQDLAKMKVGLIDRRGKKLTAFAEEWSFIGMGVGLGILSIITLIGALGTLIDGR
jgi:hypothetical protein